MLSREHDLEHDLEHQLDNLAPDNSQFLAFSPCLMPVQFDNHRQP